MIAIYQPLTEYIFFLATHDYLESLTSLLTCVKEALAIDFTANMSYLQQPLTTSWGIHFFSQFRWLPDGCWQAFRLLWLKP